MKIRQLSKEEVVDFCTKEESHFFDRKDYRVSGEKVQKAVVAFANSDGGELVIGIKDAKEEKNVDKRWAGKEKQEDFNSFLQVVTEISPSVPCSIEFLKSPDGIYVLRIIVEKSEAVHKVADGTVYVRKSAQSLPVKDHDKIMQLSFSKGQTSYEDTIVTSAAAEDIFESQQMKNFLNDFSPKSDSIDFSLNQNLIDRKTYDPKVAGILLFSDNPVPLLPKRCGIKISRYDTSVDTPERVHLKEQHTVEGPLYEQIQNAADRITETMESVQIMGEKGLVKAKYPPETIWEILVNAVIHRDYSISDDIHVLIFNNRIEIISPGKLPGYVTINNILDSRFSRNSKLVRILNKYKNPPNKDMGEGLNTAFQRMQDFKLKPPRIEENNNVVKVIIAHTPLASPEETVMSYLKKEPSIKNRQAREITGIKSENVMKGVFYSLRDSGLIEPVMSKSGNKIVAWKEASEPVH
ncbi:MAG: ATP-binding protein [Alphaproteobacteria bacterium]|nr:ATP-binding protein [Alphaproteobacteria bacterium]